MKPHLKLLYLFVINILIAKAELKKLDYANGIKGVQQSLNGRIRSGNPPNKVERAYQYRKPQEPPAGYLKTIKCYECEDCNTVKDRYYDKCETSRGCFTYQEKYDARKIDRGCITSESRIKCKQDPTYTECFECYDDFCNDLVPLRENSAKTESISKDQLLVMFDQYDKQVSSNQVQKDSNVLKNPWDAPFSKANLKSSANRRSVPILVTLIVPVVFLSKS